MNGIGRIPVNKRPPLAPPNGRGIHFSPPRGEIERGAKNQPSHKLKIAFWMLFLLLALFITGCQNSAQPQVATQATVTRPALSTPQPTATITTSPTTTLTPSPTHMPFPTPTPTATAVPANLSGNPRTINLTALPEPKSGASCGLVDVFDFPIAPPDGIGVSRGGGDFAQFRDRYDKYHAGEDWGTVGPGSNFGKPVYSVGHGRVMYAQPEGWNRDKGVVIVEHVLGETREIIYSFYGHLDPPSVVLEPGSCIRRGETVGNIGKPRTPPHLHFEMRTHMPYAPGPGYWEEDPTIAGWLPPSQTIWHQRMMSSPGVHWLREAAAGSQPIGLWRENLFLTIENGRLTQTNLEIGATQPSPLVGKEIKNGLLLEQTRTLFLETEDGVLMAFGDDLLWEIELEGNGRSELLPLPNGGVMVIRNEQTTGLSADGAILWRNEMGKRPFAWTLTDDSLIYTLSGAESSTWTATNTQRPTRISGKTGYPLTIGEEVWLYAPDGIYRLQPESDELLYPLPSARLTFSHITPLPNGGALIAHTDAYDRRLIAFNQDGNLQWDVSIANLDTGPTQLVTTANQTYLFIESNDGNNLQTKLYQVDLNNGDLTHIFNGGSRPFSFNDTWIVPTGSSQLLLNSAGGAILALDPQFAIDSIRTTSD